MTANKKQINTMKRHYIRLTGYDYSQNGLYFVTICTQNRECLFGHIVGARRDAPVSTMGNAPVSTAGDAPAYMVLNEFGKIIENIWRSLPKHHAVEFDTYQIMPNHLHFILQLTNGSHPNDTGAA